MVTRYSTKPRITLSMMTVNSRVYKNLTSGLWSIKQQDSAGKWVVVGHCTSCALNGVTATVGGSHDRVRATNTREVFAWLSGELCWAKDFVSFRGRSVVTIDAYPSTAFNRTEYLTFRPFSNIKRGFFFPRTDENFTYASCAYFTINAGVWAA